jgi:glycosyltransferase involved in cell wall biosynthesis
MSRASASQSDQAVSTPDVARIALVGPVLPFRGGISQYTTQLHRALASKCALRTISYHRQYPARLYPGKSDREPNQAAYREPSVDYLLDWRNPLSWSRATHSIEASGCSLALFDWWTLFWAPATALMARQLRRRGIRVAFLCHNLFDHDAGTFKRKLAGALLAQADAYLVHSTEQAVVLRSKFPDKPVLAHPIPLYDQFPPPSIRLPKRGRLELLFFGFIRPYKGLDLLVDALARLNDAQVYLTVVGEPWCPPEELRKRIEAARAPNIELHLDYVDDQAAANFFGRADLVVLPYLSASGSAVAAMALHYERPILATRTGAFPDVIDEGKTGFLVAPGSVEALVGAIRSLTREQLEPMCTRVHAEKSRFTWNSLAGCVMKLAAPADNISSQEHQ